MENLEVGEFNSIVIASDSLSFNGRICVLISRVLEGKVQLDQIELGVSL